MFESSELLATAWKQDVCLQNRRQSNPIADGAEGGSPASNTHAMGMAAAIDTAATITSPQPYTQHQDAAHKNMAEQLPRLHWCPIISTVPISKEEIQWAASSPEAAN